jgi:hypothetical protein
MLVPEMLFQLVLEPEDELADRTLEWHPPSLHMLGSRQVDGNKTRQQDTAARR